MAIIKFDQVKKKVTTLNNKKDATDKIFKYLKPLTRKYDNVFEEDGRFEIIASNGHALKIPNNKAKDRFK